MTDQYNTRAIVLDMLLEVIEQEKFSHTILNRKLKSYQYLDKQERAFITRLFNGTVKEYIKLDYVIDQFSTLPVNKMKPFIRNLLRLSVYQLLFMDLVPASAVCNEAVKLAKKRGFTKLAGFVNGVLRNITRKASDIIYPDPRKNPVEYLKISYSFPEWLVQELLKQYDFSTVEAMLKASLIEKTVTIRCNQNKLTPYQLEEVLSSESVRLDRSKYLPYAFVIKEFDYLENLPSFMAGDYMVQDVSSMLVCEIAGIKAEDFVIDVCAAPGGKALHAAEKADKVVARDLTEYKINLINTNKIRMGISNLTTMVWDALIPDETLYQTADVVICDLPCSGMGVFGKKADLKYKIKEEQLTELAKLQRRILKTVQAYVKTGGCLIFSTCTVNHEENHKNREWFLEHFSFQAESLDDYLPTQLRGETTAQGYLQLIQGVHETDGFFLSKFRKI